MTIAQGVWPGGVRYEGGCMSVLRLILASGSPRRRELLTHFGVPFRVVITAGETCNAPVPSSVLADLPPFPMPIEQHPALLAWRKADAARHTHESDLILAADTIVTLDGNILNKPRDADHAHAMLSQLSGRTHTVYTGLCVMKTALNSELPDQGNNGYRFPVTFGLVAAHVQVAPLNKETIAAYVATGEPLDKAGAYGIQGLGGNLVSRVEGSYTAVVGLPLPATYQLLHEAGLTGLTEPTKAYHSWLSQQRKEPLPCPPTLP